MLSGTNSLPLHLFREGQERGTQCPVIKASSSHPVTAGWDQDVIALLCKKGLPPGRLRRCQALPPWAVLRASKGETDG